MIKCVRCQQDKPDDQYRIRKDTGKPNGYCRTCSNELSRESLKRKSEGGTKRRCTYCGIWLTLDRFQKYSNGKMYKTCHGCTEVKLLKADAGRKRSIILVDAKLCLRCEKQLPLTDFPLSPRGLGGFGPYCKPCTKTYHQENYLKTKERHREQSYRWRSENRDQYLAQHRIHQFNRKSQVKATSDGTVTPEVATAIYATETCCYCGEYTPPESRTLEHFNPLALGGTHTADNVGMACKSCNSSKRDTPLEEWNRNCQQK